VLQKVHRLKNTAKKEHGETPTWRVGVLFYVSSCSCADLVRSLTERAESQVRSETNTIHRLYAKSVTSRHGRLRDVCYLPTQYPLRL
jgi:hypothetical protein